MHYDWVNKRAWAYTQTSYERLQNTTGTTTVRRYDLVSAAAGRVCGLAPSSLRRAGGAAAAAAPAAEEARPSLQRQRRQLCR